MNFEEKVIKHEPKFKGHIIDVEVQTVELPNGQTAVRDIVHHVPAVAILAITPDNKALIMQQWRTALQKVTYEVPAGKLDERDANPMQAVVRELNEETRMQAGHIEEISSFYLASGYSDELMHLYLATDLTPVADELPQDFDETLNAQAYSLDELAKLNQAGNLDDSKTQIAYWYWQANAARVKGLLHG